MLFQVSALDPSGTPMRTPWVFRFDDPIVRGTPVNGTVGLELPSFAPPGSYKIGVKVHDEVNNSYLEMTPADHN
jgi:hypothetical protein